MQLVKASGVILKCLLQTARSHHHRDIRKTMSNEVTVLESPILEYGTE